MHNAAVLDMYGNLPRLDLELDPDGGGAALATSAPLHVNCGVIEDGAYLRRGSAFGILDERQQAALAGLDRAAGIVANEAPVVSESWIIAYEPDGERPPFAVRYAGESIVDRPVRRFWRKHAAWTECEVLNQATVRQRDLDVSIVPAAFTGQEVARAA